MSDRRRALPAVNALVAEAEAAGLLGRASRSDVLAAVRAVLAAARAAGGSAPHEGWVPAIEHRLAELDRLSLRRVVNATGVILHTNLGRAPLARAAREAAQRAFGYSALELDFETGERGSRQDHCRELLRGVTGAEDALVTNNAASALLLVLSALAHGGETIVSRGELIEIGGSFRIPEILSQSGSVLVEVGTTNRTRARDYAMALSPRTRLLLKVHQSNFRQTGFVSEASLEELVALGSRRGLPVVHDVGSGLLLSLDEFGLSGEPLVRDSVAGGATVVFSGDKLAGGPQAGIVAGPASVISSAARHPLARAVRADKMTLAALEATLALYRDPALALREVPVLAMLTAAPQTLRRRARRLARRIPGAEVRGGASAVGGGAFPDATLPTWLVALTTPRCDAVLAALRRHEPPVIARVAEGCVVFDVRTLADEEFAMVEAGVRHAMERP
jgi:L-seryl-tRNA(Ser) seleniumtransferase